MVGCVIARDGETLGTGHHRVFGGAHAEVEALESCRRSGRDPRGATAFVTLEPCSHVGKTGACTKALIEAGVGEVVCAARDPGSESGGGLERLESAGVSTRVVWEPSAARTSAPFIKRTTVGLPWVVGKWAQTIDGFSATRSGESQWISGEGSRRLVHRLRGRVDAILVGAGTVHQDDPMLTARGVRVRRVALRVVIDSRLSATPGSRLAATANEAPVTVYAGLDAAQSRAAERLRTAGVEVVGVAVDEAGRVDATAALRHLAREKDVTNVLCEAGGRLTSDLVRRGLVDELLVFTAPLVFGDPSARAALSLGELARLSDARRFTLRAVRRIGDDVMSVYGADDSSGRPRTPRVNPGIE